MTSKIKVIKADITRLSVDAIVNAANSSLLGGGGVDGAIHRAGGPAILEACMKIRQAQGGCETGEAVITTAGNLPAKFVIHTVGPVWHGGSANEPKLLSNAYTNSLKIAEAHGLNSIAFPNISTGIYGYPKEKAAEIAVSSVRFFLDKYSKPGEVIFVCFDEENFQLYTQLVDDDLYKR
jgi:O-acetyl-ADP-ribose deacetylase (regulator of RNase III)